MAEDYKPQVRSLIDSDNPDIVGWHSTSVESILEAAKTGKLPGYDEKHTDDPDSSIKGLLLFTPLREQFEGMAMDGSMNYSNFMSSVHSKLYYAGGQLPPNNLLNPFAWAKFIQAWRDGNLEY